MHQEFAFWREAFGLHCADTVEDRILALQEKKRELAEAALGDGDGGVQASRLTMEDLQYLFSKS